MKRTTAPLIVDRFSPLIFCSILACLALQPCNAGAQACNRQQDSLALVQLYNAMNGPNWGFAWDLSLPMNNWWGVTLNPQGCVQKLSVNTNAIGQLPDVQLPHLVELSLSHLIQETMVSTIPDFTGMPNLALLNLNLNLTGNIPNFNHLPALKDLRLHGSQPNWAGTVPGFNHLPLLERLSIQRNTAGSVPDFTGLPNLQLLDLSLDNLATVPDFSNLPNLRELVLSANPLTGGVPDFSGLANLEKLTIVDSDLGGSFPVFTQLPSLKELVLGGGSLFGFDVEANIFGPIPDYDLPSLEKLVLRYVETSSSIPNFSHLPNLKELVITGRHLSGTLPDFAHLPNLINLQVGGYVDFILTKYSNIGGSVPNFSNLPVLKKMDLCFNRLTGEPTNFAHLPQAIKIDMSYNLLSGMVPAFDMLPAVDDIFLNNNQLTAISTQLNTPGNVKVSYNWLTFEDILPVLPALGTYAGQDSIPVQPLFYINTNGKMEADLLFDEAVSGSQYLWLKNGALLDIVNTNNHEFDLGSWDSNDEFYVEVTNPDVPSLTLMTKVFRLPLPSAIHEKTARPQLRISPNPASGLVVIELVNGFGSPSQIKVLNAVGQQELAGQPFSGTAQLAVSEWIAGIYFVVVETGFGAVVEKLVVQE